MPAKDTTVSDSESKTGSGGVARGSEGREPARAEREPGGVWRIGEASLRRAFDEGLTADGVLGFLRERSDTPLPQALEYLVQDAARRHGRLRVGAVTTYLRGDPATVAGLVRSARGRRLRLRELAPGVAVTNRKRQELLDELRKAGESPLAEEADGTPTLEPREAVRHVVHYGIQPYGGEVAPAGRPGPMGPPGSPPLDPADLIHRLRAAGGGGHAAANGNGAGPGRPAPGLQETRRG